RDRGLRSRGKAAGAADGEAAARPRQGSHTARCRRRIGGRDLSSPFDADGGPPEGGPCARGRQGIDRGGRLQAAHGGATILAPLSSADGMIAFLRGRILEKQPNRVIVDVNGVGYEVVIPLSTYYDVGDEGSEVALRVHTHVREDALQLYGFITDFERQVFERLIAISGIGPKLALAVLSGVDSRDLVIAVQRGDVARLKGIPGIGKKTAERIVL